MNNWCMRNRKERTRKVYVHCVGVHLSTLPSFMDDRTSEREECPACVPEIYIWSPVARKPEEPRAAQLCRPTS
jgi:hypothetical protein